MTQAGANWYYAVGQERNGPIDITVLRQMLASGQLNMNTLVWTDGLPNWIAAITHPDLAVAAQQQPQMQEMPPQPGMYPGYNPTAGYVPPGSTLQYYTSPHQYVYGGFWLRFGAAFLDGLILIVPNYALQFGFRAAFGLDLLGRTTGNPGAEVIAGTLIGVTQVLLGWLYSALQESSQYQATLGKRACGLVVTDITGQRISFARATGRHFGKWISAIILFIGFMMAGWTQKKQALHDIMADTLVIRK